MNSKDKMYTVILEEKQIVVIFFVDGNGEQIVSPADEKMTAAVSLEGGYTMIEKRSI